MESLHELTGQEINIARQHLLTVKAFGPFSVLEDGRLISGCMDPRADEIGDERQLTKIMGPGGAVGDAVDHAVARTAVEGRLVTVDEALPDDMQKRRPCVHGAHHDCAFCAHIVPIVGEMANPSEVTEWMVDKWVREHELDVVTRERRVRVIAAQALVLADLEESGGVQRLLGVVDDAFPEHHNVPHMRQAPAPHFYIVNGIAHLGLDRHRKHEAGLRATAYHDNLLARLNEIYSTHALPTEVRLHRMCALLYRSAATRIKIDEMKKAAGHALEHWDVEIGSNGTPHFRQVDLGLIA